MEVRNRFKGLRDDRVPDELWTEVRDIVQETGYSPWGRKESDMTERLHFSSLPDQPQPQNGKNQQIKGKKKGKKIMGLET